MSITDHVIELTGGRTTHNVVRIGATVRRPTGAWSPFVHDLLTHLEIVGFKGAPRFHGFDDDGREILDFIDGEVPLDLGELTDQQMIEGGRLLRAYHDATAGSSLAGIQEVVCHGDASPCNAVFRDGVPTAWIDFDGCYPGPRLDDVGYAAWAWSDAGEPGNKPRAVARRLGLFVGGYRHLEPEALLDAIVRAQHRLLVRCDETLETGPMGAATAAWCRACTDWVNEHRDKLDKFMMPAWSKVMADHFL